MDKKTLKQLKQFCRTERQTELIEAVIECNGSLKKAAKRIGVHPANISRAIKRVTRSAAWQGFTEDGGPQERIPDSHYLKGTSTFYDGDGNIRGRWIKTNAKLQDMLECLRDFAEGLANNAGTFDPVPKADLDFDDDILTVYPLADLHIGMLAWARECFNDYDAEICRDSLKVAAGLIHQQAPPSRQAIVANLGDFFHFDDNTFSTTSGHILDTDGRHTKIVELGVECMIYFIRLALEKHEMVKVINSLGNHDGQTALMLPLILKPYFMNEPRVTIEDSPSLHHYHIFGSNLLGFHHGHKTAPSRLHGCMTSDILLNPKINTQAVEFPHWLTGHIHHETKEFDGVLVESFRTLAAKDAYHAGNGYRALRDIQAVNYHRQFGEMSRARVSYKMIQHYSNLIGTKDSTPGAKV